MSVLPSTEAFPIVSRSISGGSQSEHFLHDSCMSTLLLVRRGCSTLLYHFAFWATIAISISFVAILLLRAFSHSTYDAMEITLWRGSSTAQHEHARCVVHGGDPQYAARGVTRVSPTQGRPRGSAKMQDKSAEGVGTCSKSSQKMAIVVEHHDYHFQSFGNLVKYGSRLLLSVHHA
jgi:hypothetical protein